MTWILIAALFSFSPLVYSDPISKDVEGKVPQGLFRLGDGETFSKFAFVVDKSKKKLYVVGNSGTGPAAMEEFDSDLGQKPGPKHELGDKRTPEGIYFFQKWIDGSELDYAKYGVGAFVTDYPNYFDKVAGRNGYGIWLHAIDDKTTLERGSKGCVVVRNDTLKKISSYISLHDTPMIIYDRVEWLQPASQNPEFENLSSSVARWKKAWEGKDLENYIGFYDERFEFGKMNLAKYREYKAELNKKYGSIGVTITQPLIFQHREGAVVRFFQEYRSTDHVDFGEKTLYLSKKSDGTYKIIAEIWKATKNSKAKSLLASGQNL